MVFDFYFDGVTVKTGNWLLHNISVNFDDQKLTDTFTTKAIAGDQI